MTVMNDDKELFQSLMLDEKKQKVIWRASHYWTYRFDMVTSEILHSGIKDFLSNDKILSSFGHHRPSYFMRNETPELDELNREIQTHTGKDSKRALRLPVWLKNFIAKYMLQIPLFNRLFKIYRIPYLSVLADRYYFSSLRLLRMLLRQNPHTCDILMRTYESREGKPTTLIEHTDDKMIGEATLKSVIHTSYIHKYLKPESRNSFLEIGGGYGALCSTILRTTKEVERYLLIDLPQTCYLTTQYLKALFPGEVVSYTEVRDVKEIGIETFGKRKIIVAPTWMLPKVNLRFDCFINTSSFQEMEKKIIRNYLKYVKKLASHAYIFTLKRGHPQGFTRDLLDKETIVSLLEENGFKERNDMDMTWILEIVEQIDTLSMPVFLSALGSD